MEPVGADSHRILRYLSTHSELSERTSSALCMALGLSKAQWETLLADLIRLGLVTPDGDWSYQLTPQGWSLLESVEQAGRASPAPGVNPEEMSDAATTRPEQALEPVYSIEDWGRLRPYLTTSLFQNMQATPIDQRPALCQEHLQRLLGTIATYLPHHLALTLLRHPLPPRLQVQGQFLEGTLLFADISGFTALSEMLRVKGGKQGAEELIQLINKYLDVMLDILFRHQGQLIKFGGDAMLGLFTGTVHGALNCVRAAWEMKQAMREHFDNIVVYQEIVPLTMKVGSNSGMLFAATVGDEAHMEYILTGQAVEQTAHAESSASKGEILISKETLELVQDHLQVEEVLQSPGFYRVVGLQPEKLPPVPPTWEQVANLVAAARDNFWLLVDRLDALSPYLPSGVLSQLVYSPYQERVEGQHRQVTVLFVNFIGMSEIIRALGVDDSPAITRELNTYFQAMQDEIQYYGGVINKVDLYDTGDKLMVIFGAPFAHERDSHRAALTALAMQRAMNRLSSPLASRLLSQRIGIHTGFVFAGNVGSTRSNRREYTVMGDTVNMAARLMSKAPGGEIWISQDVFDQIHQSFATQALPPVELKGITGQVPVYALLADRLGVESLPSQGWLSSTLIGREQELATLRSLVADMLQGMGIQVVSIVAEGGVGKTRLVAEWQRLFQSEPANHILWVTSQGRLYGQKTNGIFTEVLEKLVGFVETDTDGERWQKLTQAVGAIFTQPEPKLAYLGQFLALDTTLRPELAPMLAGLSAENLQLQMRLAICDLLTHFALTQPVVLILEDLHWADEASLDLLKFLLDRLSDDLPVLFCLTYRPRKERPIWQTWQELVRIFPDCAQVELRELSEGQSRQLLFDLLNSQHLPQEFQNLVYTATDGNPLYTQEVLSALAKDGVLVLHAGAWQLARQVEAIQVPESLFQIIQSRIDELDFSSPGARRVLWMAAIIGDEFKEDLLLYLFTSAGYPRNELLRHLRELRNAGMLERASSHQDDQAGSWYRFRHGLVRQVTYENMLLSNRRDYHNLAGQWLEANHLNDQQRFLDALTDHFDRGEVWDKAIHYHYLAGERDARLYENRRAVVHLERALGLMPLVPPDPELLGLLHLKLGQVLSVMGDFEQALAHLIQASDILGNLSTAEAEQNCARSAYEVARVYERRGGHENLGLALTWQEKGLATLSDKPSPEAARLHGLGGLIRLRLLDLDGAAREAQIALSFARSTHADLAFLHRVLSMTARAQGNLAAARRHCDQAVAISEPAGDLLGLAIALSNQGVVALEMNDWTLAARAYQRALDIQQRIGDLYQIAMTCCNLGDLYYHTGDMDAGFACVQRGLHAFQKVASGQGEIFARTVLATLHLRKQSFPEALQELLQARSLVNAQDESEFQAAVGRWLAQAYLSLGDLAAAEAEIIALMAMPDEELGIEREPVQRLYAQMLASQGQLERGRQVLQASLERLVAGGEKHETGCTRLALAELLARQHDYQGSRSQAELALALFTELGARLDAAQAQHFLTHNKD